MRPPNIVAIPVNKCFIPYNVHRRYVKYLRDAPCLYLDINNDLTKTARTFSIFYIKNATCKPNEQLTKKLFPISLSPYTIHFILAVCTVSICFLSHSWYLDSLHAIVARFLVGLQTNNTQEVSV